jgi:hypothetical protein
MGGAFRKIPQPRRESAFEEKNGNGRAQQKVPEDQPIAALEISVGPGALLGWDRVEPGASGRRRIEPAR